MERVYNYSAGPSALPLEVLERAAREMTNCDNSGMSVMEMSHRSKEYEAIIFGAEKLFRELMNIPEDYAVLFLQGGASSQFAMIPLNLMNKSNKADFVLTGQWAQKAFEQASLYGDCKAVASSKDKTYSYIPKLDKSMFREDSDYVHITLNNTIYGTKFSQIPDVGNIPLIADISSCILSEELDVSKFAMLYAGAQKNIGPAGLTVVIIKKELIGNARDITPIMFDYKIHLDNDSMYNTPPTYSIYICKLVLEWLKSIGGVKAIQKINYEKANLLYDYLDGSSFFSATVEKEDRSIMNIPFLAPNDELNKKFISEAKAAGFVNLAGHRSVGGMRASIYNGMGLDGVQALVDFMKKFEAENEI
jgi:phosphoserine aminotransferase